MRRRLAAPARVLVADPPWQFGDRLPGETRGAASQYRTMSVEEICDYPVPWMFGDSFLFLWRVSAMQEEALRVARAWGFRVVAEFVWEKETRTGKLHFGMGRTVRLSHEVCLIAKRGSPPVRSASVRSVFRAPVGRHSEKPDVFYERVEELAFGPYAEVFARRRRDGWTCYGDELPSLPRHGARHGQKSAR